MFSSETRGHVAIVTLRREERRNAFNAELTGALDRALNTAEDDPAIRAVVLAAAGPVFSAGTDLKDGAGEPTPRGGEYGIVRRRRTKPLIAAVDGPALGGGMEVVMACDLVVASPAASFALPEATRGVVATCGGLFRTGRALPPNVARQLLLTGDSLQARRAYDLGFVTHLVEDRPVVEVALEVAAGISQHSPTSIRATLKAVDAYLAPLDAPGWDATAGALEEIRRGPDLEEALAAFREKRAPVWSDPLPPDEQA